MNAKAMSDEKRWRAEDDLRILISAAEIRKDKARMATAMKVAAEKKRAMESIVKGKYGNQGAK